MGYSFIHFDSCCNTGSWTVGAGACLSWPWEAGYTLDQSADCHRAVVGYIYSDSNYFCLVYFRFQWKWPTSYRDNKYGPHTSLDHTMGTNLWFCPWVLTLSEHQQWWLPQNDFYHPCWRIPEWLTSGTCDDVAADSSLIPAVHVDATPTYSGAELEPFKMEIMDPF